MTLSNSDIAAMLTPDEWRALIYLNRADEIGQFATDTDVQAVIRQFETFTDRQVRSAMACLVCMLHLASGSFAEAGHWIQVATGEAVRSTWVSARVSAIQANQLLWNSDLALARELLDEAEPIDHPLSNIHVRVVRIRMAYDQGDFPSVTRLLDGIVSDDCADPLGVGPSIAAIYVASVALAEGRLADAELAIREALLVSADGTRSNALLVDRLAHVMARCGLTRETAACRATAQAGLSRWPAQALGSKHALELMLSALGTRFDREMKVDTSTKTHWPADAGTSGQRITELQIEADTHLAANDAVSARRTIAALVQMLGEHTKGFESTEARALAVHSLADIPGLAIGLGRLGDAGDAIRITQAAMRIIIADQTRGETAARYAEQLRPLLDWARSADSEINPTELADLDIRIRHLERRRRSTGSSLPSDGWLDQPLSNRELVLFQETDGHLWRVTSSKGESHLADLGPMPEVEHFVRSFRLAAAALGLGHPEAEARLADAAEAVDSMVLGGCSWEAGEQVVMVPGRALVGLPWRLLPTMQHVRLEITTGDSPVNPTVDVRRRRISLINGPGLGTHVRPESDEILACYPEATVADEFDLTPSRLIDRCCGTDVVHVVGHGRVGRTRFRLPTTFDDDLAEQLSQSANEDIANVVVFGSTDLTLSGQSRNGLAWFLVGHGIDHVIASAIDLDDDETTIIMPALHRLLADGVHPSSALQQLVFDDPRVQAAADALVCISHDPSR